MTADAKALLEKLQEELRKVERALEDLRAERLNAPIVYIDEDSDIWLPEDMDMKGKRIRARLMDIEILAAPAKGKR